MEECELDGLGGEWPLSVCERGRKRESAIFYLERIGGSLLR